MTITKLLTTAFRRLNDWRRAKLFVTAKESRILLAGVVEEAATMNLKARLLWADMQQLKMEVNGKRQFIQITLLLDRKALALLDVTDAARLIAGRTERIYCEKIKEALKKAK